MVMEVGFALHPRDIRDLVKTYVTAVDQVLRDPRFADRNDMAEFWREFVQRPLLVS
jgi:hypothetical protein